MFSSGDPSVVCAVNGLDPSVGVGVGGGHIQIGTMTSLSNAIFVIPGRPPLLPKFVTIFVTSRSTLVPEEVTNFLQPEGHKN